MCGARVAPQVRQTEVVGTKGHVLCLDSTDTARLNPASFGSLEGAPPDLVTLGNLL